MGLLASDIVDTDAVFSIVDKSKILPTDFRLGQVHGLTKHIDTVDQLNDDQIVERVNHITAMYPTFGGLVALGVGLKRLFLLHVSLLTRIVESLGSDNGPI